MKVTMEPISWTSKRVKLGDLVPWERNPRQISKAKADRLLESFEKFGQVEVIAIGPELDVYNGHQRLSILRAKYGDSYKIDARVASRSLTEKEREQLTVFLHVGATGSFNWDELAGWDASELNQWGFDEETLKAMSSETINLRELLMANFEYEPKVDPSIGDGVHTQEEIDREAQKLKDRFGDEKDYFQVTCPKCGEDFMVNRKDVKDATP